MAPADVYNDAFNSPGGAPIPMADGGAGIVTRPTLFLAGESGVPEKFQFTPMMGGGMGDGGGGGSAWNGDLVIHGATDPHETARVVIQTLQDRGIISKTLLR